MSIAFNSKKIDSLAYNGKMVNALAYNGQLIYKKRTLLYGNRNPYITCNNFSISSGVSFYWEMGGIMYPKTTSGGNYTGCNGRSHGLGLQRRITLNCVDGYLRVSLGTSGAITTSCALDEKYHVFKFYTNTTTGTPSTWYIEVDGAVIFSHSYGFNSGTSYIDFHMYDWYTGSLGPSDPMRQALEYFKLIRNNVTVYDCIAVKTGDKPDGASSAATANTMFNKINNSYMAVTDGPFSILTVKR